MHPSRNIFLLTKLDLLTKLEIYGLDKHALAWIKSYLYGRKQLVTMCHMVQSPLVENHSTDNRQFIISFYVSQLSLFSFPQNAIHNPFQEYIQNILKERSV